MEAASDSREAWRLAWAGMFSLVAAMGIGRFVYTPALPRMMQELDLSAVDGGLIASANFLGYFAGAMVGGGRWAAGRERIILVAALIANAALCLAMALTHSVNVFMVLRFAAGLASAFVMLYSSAIVLGSLNAMGASKLQDLHFAGVGSGIALSSLMVLMLFAVDLHEWQGIWLASAAVGFLAAAAVMILLPGRQMRPGQQEGLSQMPWSESLLRAVICFGLFGIGYSVSATFLIALARQQGATQIDEAMLWLIVGVTAALSVPAGSFLARRFGLVQTLTALCIAEAAGVAACVLLPVPLGVYLGAFLFGVTFMSITALALDVARRLVPQHARRVFSIMTISFSLGQILGPLLSGFVVDATGDYVAASLGAAALLVIAAFIVWPAKDRAVLS
ncbi:YbfB/YjiJ family MFS transporter [Limoniibacter endophyticus]|uniref:MFS transporter n=1 Tax=Limoniibacter endophyticus TaxID=1565040 RepID=A0A8J3DQ74_9HYPH|nr:YbfB/YjiJ family MFS transporter [Limoniibacter endophyticus]GHC71213.1 MFS transporter [Limoniibacter endophyticus]